MSSAGNPLLKVYAVVPLALALAAMERATDHALGRWCQAHSEWLLIYFMAFGSPHVVASFFPLADKALRSPVQGRVMRTLLVCGLFAFASSALLSARVGLQFMIVVTMIHVLGQQTGIAAGQARLSKAAPRALVTTWRWLLACAGALAALGVGGEARIPVVEAPEHWMAASGALLFLCMALGTYLTHRALRQGGDVRALVAVQASMATGYLLVLADHPWLGIAVLRWLHDVTAIRVYTHLLGERDRQAPGSNVLFRSLGLAGRRALPWAVWPLGIVVAGLIHRWLPHPVTLSLVLAHYVLEHDLWRPGSPWRRAIQRPG